MNLPFSLDEQFIVLREIKAGGFGIVYAGWDENLSLPVALKEIHPELLRQESHLAAFQAEAQLIVRLDHPAICRLYTLKRWRGRVFMIMEFIDGGDLRLLQMFLKERNQSLSPQISLYLIQQVARALHYAHVRQDPSTGAPLHLVHRDIAPSNFMISRMGAVKLIDFGIARVKGVMRPETMGGIIKGRPQYMSPEQIHSPDSVDLRSDVYSLAVVFLDMLTGHSIYGKTTNEYELLDRVRARKFDLPQYFQDHRIPPELQPCIEHALKLSVFDRTATAKEFESELQAYAGAIRFQEEQAHQQLCELAQLAFPPSNLGRDYELFQAARRESVTKEYTEERKQPDSAAPRSREFTVSDVPPLEPVRPKHGPGVLGWVLGAIFLVAVGVFVYIQFVVEPAEQEKRRVEQRRIDDSLATAKAESLRVETEKRKMDADAGKIVLLDTTKASAGTEPPEEVKSKSEPEKKTVPKDPVIPAKPAFVVTSPVAANVYISGSLLREVLSGGSVEINRPDGRYDLRFELRGTGGCKLSRTYSVDVKRGGSFTPSDLYLTKFTLEGRTRPGQVTTIRCLDAQTTLGPGCDKLEPPMTYLFLPGRYEVTTKRGTATDVANVTLSGTGGKLEIR